MSKESLSNMDMLESEDDFANAYEAYRPLIFRFLLWRTQDSELSDDLTSNVFEKAWRSRANFHGGSVQAWLYRIARNTLTDHWRRPKDVIVDDIDTIGESNDTTAERLDSQQEIEQMRQAIRKLPPTMRDIVELRFIERLSVKVVAERLDLSEANVRVTQYRALKQIRKLLS